MMQKDGKVTPRVAITAPGRPFCRKPTKVEQLMATGPGVDSAITVIFIISSWEIQFFFSTQIFSISEIIAYPPPKVKRPILKKVKNKSNSRFMVFLIPEHLCVISFVFMLLILSNDSIFIPVWLSPYCRTGQQVRTLAGCMRGLSYLQAMDGII